MQAYRLVGRTQHSGRPLPSLPGLKPCHPGWPCKHRTSMSATHRRTGHVGPDPAVSWMQCVLAPLGPALSEHDHPCVCAACGKRTPVRSGSASRSSDVRRRIVPNCRREVTREEREEGERVGVPDQHAAIPFPSLRLSQSLPHTIVAEYREAVALSTAIPRAAMFFRTVPGAMLYHFPSAGNVSLSFCGAFPARSRGCRTENGHHSQHGCADQR